MGTDTLLQSLLAVIMAGAVCGCQATDRSRTAATPLSFAGDRVCAAPSPSAPESTRQQVSDIGDASALPDSADLTSGDTAIPLHLVESPDADADSCEATQVTSPDTSESKSAIQFVSSETSQVMAPALTLDELEQIALKHNPTIRELSASATQASGIQNQSGLYPNPVIGYSAAQLADRGTDQQGVFLEQEIVLGDKLALNRQVHHQDVQVRLWEVEAQRQRVLTDVRQLFYQALAIQRRLQLTEEFHAVAFRGAELARMRREALNASQPEVLQAQIQLQEVSLAKRQAEIELAAVWRKLAAGTGLRSLERTELQGSLDPGVTEYDWDVVYDDLCGRSPELAAARAEVQRARIHLCRQQRQPIPNLNLQLIAGRDNGTNNGFLNVQAAAPIPVFNRNEGNIRAAYADLCRATHEVRRVELSLQSRLANSAQDFDSAAAGVRTYRDEIMPRAQETLDLSEQAYGAGEFGFLEVLVARRTFFESSLRYVGALNELAQANTSVDGLLLSGGLSPVSSYTGDDALRGQALEGR